MPLLQTYLHLHDHRVLPCGAGWCGRFYLGEIGLVGEGGGGTGLVGGDFIRGVWVVGDEEGRYRVALWEISFGGDWVIVEVLLVRDLEIRSGKL